MSLGNTFVQTLVTPSHPGSTPGTPLPWRWKWGYLRRQPCSQDSCSLGMGGGSCVLSLWSLPPQMGLGLSGRPRPYPWRSGGGSRLPISDAGKCFPPIPPHPWTAAPSQAQGWGGRMVRSAWEMLWSGSSSQVLTRPPLTPRRESSASSEKVHTPHKSF